jgi:uncharacterized protein YbjT (DUF2867 family)
MITVMGATGHVGGRITEVLLARGERMRAIARHEDKLVKLANRGADIRVGDALDSDFLASAFKGSDAIFTMIPPNFAADDFLAYQRQFGESIVRAVNSSGITRVVNLSSLGAELSAGTGPILGLHEQEERFNKLKDVDILHLRPASFMENLLSSIPLIKSKGLIASANLAEKPMPMIAAVDIGDIATDRLIRQNFRGHTVLGLAGPEPVSMAAATYEIGRAIGLPLPYATLSPQEAEQNLIAGGFKPDLARLYVEMIQAFNDDRITEATEPLIKGKTTFQDFVRKVFVPAYSQWQAPAPQRSSHATSGFREMDRHT